MIINHTYKFIFIKTRKTASTSLEIALSKFCGPDDVITTISQKDEEIRSALEYPGPRNYERTPIGPVYPSGKLRGHQRATEVRKFFPDIWQSYFTFCFERNPFDRAISRYFWEQRRGDIAPPMNDFLRSIPVWMLSSWDLYTDSNGLIVDFAGKYENLQADLNFVQDTLRLPKKIVLPQQKAKSGFRSDHRHYREVLSTADRQLIENICSREIDHFSYAW